VGTSGESGESGKVEGNFGDKIFEGGWGMIF
jgi:hypothetical protein